MSKTWQQVALRDVLEIKHGWPFKSELFSETLTGKPIVVAIGNFQYTGGFRFNTTATKEYLGEYPRQYELKPRDILLVMTCQTEGGEILGIPARIPDDGKVYLHNQRLGKVVIKRSDQLDRDFIYWVFLWKDFNDELVASSSGTKIKHTAPLRIEQFGFSLPPLDEQRAIARVLGALDDKIELNRRMNRTLEELASALFRSWFVDFDPVIAKAAGRKPAHLRPDLAALFPAHWQDSPLGPIPHGWRVAAIGDVVTVVGGSTPRTNEPKFWNGDIAWATPRDLAALTEQVLIKTNRQITAAGLHEIGSGLLPKGTVLLSSRAPIGYTAIADIPVAVNQGFIALICDGPLPNYYVIEWVRENMDTIEGNANGTTFMEISKKNFRPIAAVVPPPEVLEIFMEIASPWWRQIIHNVRESQTLAALRDTLLPKLLSGELRVKQAEK